MGSYQKRRAAKERMFILGIFLWSIIDSIGTNGVYASELSYNGRLVDGKGQPLDGPVTLKIRFYRSETDSTALDPILEFPSTPLIDGIYSVTFKLLEAQISEIFGQGSSTPVFVEVEANGTIFSRQRYLSAPSALRVPVDNSTLIFNSEGKLTVDTISQSQVIGLTDKLNSLINPDTARSSLGLGSLATLSMVSSSQIAPGAITNSHINATAGIQDSKLATIESPGKVSGDAITSGTITGTTSIDTSGSIKVANLLELKSGVASSAELRFSGDSPAHYLALKASENLSSGVT
jgi:hypothetical protein